MSQLQLSLLLSLLCVATLAIAGWRPYAEEFRERLPQIVAAFLLVGILAVAVFYPVTSFGEAEEIDPETIWFPSLLFGHCILSAFLFLWWRLRRDIAFAAFLHLSWSGWWDKIRHGVATGCGGWVVTVMATGAAAGLFGLTGRLSAPTEAPPLILWLAELPILYRLIIVGVAMTVEEAFFRGFLQPRFGLLVSSILFALSHFSYGLPFMIVGVFTISLIIGRTFERERDLLPCIIAHGIFDGVQLLIVLPWVVHTWSPAGPL
ncbi:MAG: CPBP family intramembrane glutamic endopeptidase [Candidatus Binatia bacterium]